MQLRMQLSLNVKLTNPLEFQVISSYLNASDLFCSGAATGLEGLHTLTSNGLKGVAICARHAVSASVPLGGSTQYCVMMVMIEVIQQIICMSSVSE
jgi:hypothetical protein